MLCDICRQGLEGIWDASKTKRACRIKDFNENFHEGDSTNRVYLPTMTDGQDKHPSQYMFGHHLTLDSYLQSVSQGCIACRGLGYEGREVSRHSVIAQLGYYSLFTVTLGYLGVSMEVLKPGTRLGIISLNCYDISMKDLNLDLSPSTGDPLTWRLVQGWMDNCLQTHVECKQANKFVPPYLLQLDGENQLFRLVSDDEVHCQPDTRYCTLSHCYSPNDTALQLTTATLENLSIQQSLSNLPLTYQDAFAVVARLGLRYLWIDHLCTLQDKPGAHGEKRDILRNSFCGISATGSTLPSSGLFIERKPELIIPTVFELPLDDCGGKTLVKSENSGEKPFLAEPLIKTAKGFQERLLTPRMIHFGSSLVYWECFGSLCNEIHPCGIPLKPRSYRIMEEDMASKHAGVIKNPPSRLAWKPLLITQSITYPYDNPRVDILDRWYNLLQTYTCCTSATADERLACVEGAFLGMKPLLREHGCDDTYLSGLWLHALPSALIWTPASAADRPTGYQAPSWSWAAVNGPITYDYRRMREIRNGSLCTLTGAPHTAINNQTSTADKLVLQGKLITGRLSYNDFSDYIKAGTLPSDVAKDRYSTQMNVMELVGTGGGSLIKAPIDANHLVNWFIRFDTKHEMKLENLLFPISLVPVSEESNEVYMYGIALVELDNGVYRRCGIWQIALRSQERARGILHDLCSAKITIV
ncbi:unnamed protein product [Clonostachys rosea]|uniref:Heterokaryon incompatibility domain-containing protein n=1 Tax=Bionectria ochroleuca TaxID=29856 RepID=A0ABY6UDT3_BIOOC|nr:unnamed protein product [Clonostachys rosea]